MRRNIACNVRLLQVIYYPSEQEFSERPFLRSHNILQTTNRDFDVTGPHSVASICGLTVIRNNVSQATLSSE